MIAHVIFNGQSRLLKCYVFGEGAPRHVLPARDVGVNDADVQKGEDVYGYRCKCPPGAGYILSAPIQLHEPPYGFGFTPIGDNAAGTLAAHGRSGLGIHGGGSDLPDPFAPHQGWEDTFGCIRLQNEDNATFMAFLSAVFASGGSARLDVVWP